MLVIFCELSNVVLPSVMTVLFADVRTSLMVAVLYKVIIHNN